MSTFGKKSLSWWNYHDQSSDNVRRFALTTKDMQLEILKKWYPIGFKVREYSFARTYTVIGYIESISCWNLKLESDDNFGQNKHPLTIVPLKSHELEIKRQIKLDKILR